MEYIGPLILEKIQMYILTRAELLYTLFHEIPCTKAHVDGLMNNNIGAVAHPSKTHWHERLPPSHRSRALDPNCQWIHYKYCLVCSILIKQLRLWGFPGD